MYPFYRKGKLQHLYLCIYIFSVVFKATNYQNTCVHTYCITFVVFYSGKNIEVSVFPETCSAFCLTVFFVLRMLI